MLEVKVERCAGIDVGKKVLAVCIMIGLAHQKPTVEVRRFGTNVMELERLRVWLKEMGCTEAVMESTGSYWKPVYNVLEGTVKIILANPMHVKVLRGKKTDSKDSRWLAGLLRHGLVEGSFIPPRDIRELRDLTRRRRTLLSDGAAERNRVQKILEDANVKIGNVLTDVFGVSGQAMLEAFSGKEAERGRDRGIGARPVKAEDAADRRSTGRTPDDGSSPVPDWAMPEAHAVHRRDDRRFGQADPGKAAVLFKAGPIGVHSTGNSAGCGREHFSGDWNGYESRRTLSGLSPSGIVGGNMSW